MTDDTSRNDGRLDLSLKRTIDAPPALIWKAWTDPQQVKKWWAPAPWTTTECEIDLRPGGLFRTVMRSPEGQDFPYDQCFLELIENEKIVVTNALEPGYRPGPRSVLHRHPYLRSGLERRATRCLSSTEMKRAERSTRTWVSTTAGTSVSTNWLRW